MRQLGQVSIPVRYLLVMKWLMGKAMPPPVRCCLPGDRLVHGWYANWYSMKWLRLCLRCGVFQVVESFDRLEGDPTLKAMAKP